MKIMEMITTSHGKNLNRKKKFWTSSKSEKFILFMYSVDPNFEALIIYLSEYIKGKMKQKFGLYDPNLIKIEKEVLRQLLKTNEQNKINAEAEKRAFK